MQKASFLSGSKFPGIVQTESSMEATTAMLAELDPRVTKIQPQPCTIDLLSGEVFSSKTACLDRFSGTGHIPKPYTPDFRITKISGASVFLETKHRRWIKVNPEYQDLPVLLGTIGLDLQLVTDELLFGPIQWNARVLARYVRGEKPPQEACERLQGATVRGTVLGALFDDGFDKTTVYAAIAHGYLACNIVNSRLSPTTAVQWTVFAQDILKVEQPFDRVEIDCTTADIFVVDDEGNVVGRPTICAAIDAATGVILAMQLSLSAPSQSLVARTLKEMLVPKDDSFFDRHGISNRFQAYGRPLTIVTDQGSENGGDMIEAFVTAGATEWQKNLPKHPWKKPFIERLFREINAFLQKLPGATCTAEIKRQDRTEKAMKEASLTLDDLENMLQVWRYDSYGMKPRRRVMNPLRSQESPTKCWRRLETTGFLDAPYTAGEVRNMFMVRSEARTLFRYGINFKRLIYAGPELSSIITKIGTGQKVEVCFDPHDIREIAVLDPDTGRHVPVRTKDPEMPAISFAELAEILEKTKPDPEEEIAARLVLAELAMAADKAGKSNKGLRSRRKAEIGRRKAREVNARSLHDKKVEMPLVDEAHAIPKPLKRPESYTRMVPR